MKLIEFEIDLDKFGNERLRVKLRVDKGELMDLVYQYESFVDNGWVAVVRYDVAHGFFHRDELFADGRKDKIEVTIKDLKSASKYAEQDIKDRWEWYKERYFKKIKKKNNMTNKETVERNIGLTFDFVHYLIDNPSALDDLPKKFKLEFLEKDFHKTESPYKTKTDESYSRKFVRVANTFEFESL